MTVLQLPLMLAIGSAGWTLLVTSAVALVVVAIPGALLSATMSENFPTRIRTKAIGFAYSISVAVFGGTAPYLNQLLINLGIGWVSSVYIMMLCVCTGVAVWLMPETKGNRPQGRHVLMRRDRGRNLITRRARFGRQAPTRSRPVSTAGFAVRPVTPYA